MCLALCIFFLFTRIRVFLAECLALSSVLSDFCPNLSRRQSSSAAALPPMLAVIKGIDFWAKFLSIIPLGSCSHYPESFDPSSFVTMMLFSSILLYLFLRLTLTSSLLLSGYNSYSLYPFYSTNRSLSLEFSTNTESGLLLYTQDSSDVYFLELKLSLGQLVLRYDLTSGMKLLTIGSKLNDGLWHRVEISIGKSLLVTLDGFVSVGGSGVGGWGVFGGIVYIGGLPPQFIDNLDRVTLPSAVFEPRWNGGVRRLSYAGQHVQHTGGEAHMDPLPPCPFPPPCIHGTCIPTLSGPHCDCTNTKYTGHYCNELRPEELARFDGQSFISYNSSRIMSSVDEIEMEWKTNEHNSGVGSSSSILFYAGDGRDHMSLHLRSGKLWLSINLGSGPLEVEIEAGGGHLADGRWHSIKIIRRVQEITSVLDGLYNSRWTLAGNFKILSSTFVSIGGGGGFGGGDSNFHGCMKNVHFTADSLKLNLIELSRSRSRLVGTSGVLGTECQQDTKSHPRTTLTFTRPSSSLEIPLPPTVRNITLSLRTTEPDGLILSTNSTSLELIAGQLYLNVGGLKVLASQDPITDGEWHEVSIMRNWRGGRIVLDATVTDWNGEDEDWGEGLSLGGGGVGIKTGSIVWSKGLNKGFVGCLGGVSLAGVSIDLGLLSSQQDIGSIRSSCTPGNGGSCISSPCLNNGRCSEGWNRYICDCRGTEWTGGTCARLAPKLSLDGTQGINIKQQMQLQALDLSIRFRTTNRASGDLISLEDGMTSLRLSLTLTRLKLTYNLSSSERSIITGSDLNDNLYHLVKLSTRGNVFQMQVDDWPVVSDQVLSRDFRLNISVIKLGSFSSRQPYAGIISQVILNSVDLLEHLDSSYLIKNNTNYNTVSISDYISLEQLKGYRENRILFNFKTRTGGLLLFNAGPLDWITIEIHDGKVWFSYNDGSPGGVKELSAGDNVADGRWHSVKVHRGDGVRGDSLTCDGKVTKSDFTYTPGTLDLNGVLYIGGVPQSMYKTLSFRSARGFVGCLASLELGGEAVDPIQDSLKTPTGVSRGCNETESCSSSTCSNSAPCIQSWPGPSCDCEMSSYTGPQCSVPSTSYKFNRAGGLVLYTYEVPLSTRDDKIAFGLTTKSKSGTIIHSKSIDSNDFLKIEMSDGRLLVSYNTGDGSKELLHPASLSDGVYHVLQVYRLGSNMTINIPGHFAVNSNSIGSHHTVLHDQSQIEIGGVLRSGTITQPFRGTLSGLTINGVYMLDLAAERDNKIRLIGDVVQVREAEDGKWIPDDHAMQKTPPSNPPLDDLVSSAGPPCIPPGGGGGVDDEDNTCLYPPDGGGSGDELITPVYVPSPPPSSQTPSGPHLPPNTAQGQGQKKGQGSSRGGLECDDEDCNLEGSGVLTSTVYNTYVSTSNSNNVPSSTTYYSVPPSSTHSFPPSSTHDFYNPPVITYPPPPPPTIISTPPDLIVTPAVVWVTRAPFTPPTTPPYIHSPTFRIFDWPEATSKPPLTKPTDPRNSFVAEAGDSTLVIIIIIALLMIIIVSILIIFFMCKRKEEGVYKVEDKGRYEFVGGGGGGAGQPRGAAAGPGRKAGGGVKEWYV